MKKLITLAAIGLYGIATSVFAAEPTPIISHGFYAGIGGGWNTIDETYASTLFTSTHKSAHDNYNVSSNRLAPLIQLGYWRPFNETWLWGVTAQWEYLGYQTANVNSSRGQYIQNASFSSINFFGPDVLRDFTSQTNINNEVLLLFYLGMQMQQSYVYLGLGPALFTASNNIYVSSVHTPHGGSNLVSTSVGANNTLWGGAAQVGFNLYLNPIWFLNFSYTYLKSTTGSFNNSANATKLNGGSAGPTTLNLNRAIRWSTQEVTLSINKVF